MTQNQFNGIHPSIALENENILQALRNKEYDNIPSLLESEF